MAVKRARPVFRATSFRPRLLITFSPTAGMEPGSALTVMVGAYPVAGCSILNRLG
jgi:hypothetical protein